MRPLPVRAACAAALLAAGGCTDPTGPAAPSESEAALASGLRLTVTATPAVVSDGDSVALRVVVRNPTGDRVTVTSGCSALAMLGVARANGDESRLAAGTGCLAVVSTFTLAPGEAVAYENRVLVRAYDGRPAPRGRYVAQAYSVLAGDMRVDAAGKPLPNAEAGFEVR